MGVAPGFEALLSDPAVTHILVIGPDAALVDRGEGLKLHPDTLGDANAVADTLWRYANTAYPPPPPDNPVVDVRLPDGTRISAAFPPAAPAGVVGSIRRPGLPERPLAELIPGGSGDVQSLLETVAATRRNLLVTGDATAVTIALGALAGALPPITGSSRSARWRAAAAAGASSRPRRTCRGCCAWRRRCVPTTWCWVSWSVPRRASSRWSPPAARRASSWRSPDAARSRSSAA